MELRDYQQTALEKLGNGKILYGGVGSGKSFVAVKYYMATQGHKPVYVITTAKKRESLDWLREFAREGVGTQIEATTRGVLTVDSFNNISKYQNVTDAFFIFDEQRLVGSGSWVKNFLKIARRNQWIMLSGTPGDTWLDYAPVFIANGMYANRTEFKAKHVVYKPYTKFPQIDHYTDTGRLLRNRAAVLVRMPFQNHTTRHVIDIPVEHNRDLIKFVIRQRWNPFGEAPIRGAAEFYSVMRKIVNTDLSRLEALREVLKKHPKLIVFYNFDYELDILRTLDGVEISELNGHKHQKIPSTVRWAYLVQYAAGAEAWECIETNAVFEYSLVYSYKQLMQARGRIDRLNTTWTDLYYYRPMSDSMIERSISRVLGDKRSFNESSLSDFY